ncbi:hypothetical protein BASA50_001242 [Batrachochytrium salamandrivorans]|uniref:Sec20 C-terminal domain-containing protein n=1 Tax=Batrachochytrium salamandrivorans TaxID=1357716 RepID=A0ABQ8EUY2_9FUNG|nr:hypothetical protein BASA60_008444 [Batrachochytrium salamandrivorans]KAH6579401.1 hypothetical protein BASA61_010259 [Batrachochytrium salamandrivorans]KAH6585634.1 hypothetical protein BASA50_001242 [Batrachochytrium salamandrivorans]
MADLLPKLDALITRAEQNVASLEKESSRPAVLALGSSIQRMLTSIDTLIEEIEDAILDIKRQNQATSLRESIAQQKQSAVFLLQRYRTAMVSARKTVDARSSNDRAELLRSRNSNSRDMSDRAAIRASNEITDGLQQAVKMISAEMERSIETVNALEQSTKTLSRTQQEYSVIEDLLGTSKSIITSLNSRDWMDRALLAVGLLIFSSTLLYTIGRRVRIPGYAWATGQCETSTSWVCF